MMQTASVLDNVKHARLLEDIGSVCTQAGVPETYIHNSMREYCNEQECKWVLNFNRLGRTGKHGLILHGNHIDVRGFAIGGALIRNFIDARVYTLQRVLDEDPHPTVLIIPNFFIAAIDCKPQPAWKIDLLYGLLLDRMTQGLQTVVGISDMKMMQGVYGDQVFALLRDSYLRGA